MKVSGEGFVKPPKVVGGTSVDSEDHVGIFFRVNYVPLPQRWVQEIGVVRIWGRPIALRRSRGRTRGVECVRGGDHRSAGVGEGND